VFKDFRSLSIKRFFDATCFITDYNGQEERSTKLDLPLAVKELDLVAKVHI
jgi:hypothetical protein